MCKCLTGMPPLCRLDCKNVLCPGSSLLPIMEIKGTRSWLAGSLSITRYLLNVPENIVCPTKENRIRFVLKYSCKGTRYCWNVFESLTIAILTWLTVMYCLSRMNRGMLRLLVEQKWLTLMDHQNKAPNKSFCDIFSTFF